MNKQKQAFTLVELIVVITILAILGTIGFFSLQGFSQNARDSTRITDMSSIAKGFELEVTKLGKLPVPEDKIDIIANGTVISYQGYAGKKTLNKIGILGDGKDPLDQNYYTYVVNKNLTQYQILGYLESEEVAFNNKFIERTNALDLTERFPVIKGNELGILIDNITKEPVQSNLNDIDIINTNTEYTLYFNNKDISTGTGSELKKIESIIKYGKVSSCSDLLKKRKDLKNEDGIYTINPTGYLNVEVYCDMTTQGGGWTLVGKWDKDWTSGYVSAMPKGAFQNNINIKDLTFINKEGDFQSATLSLPSFISNGAEYLMHAGLNNADSTYRGLYFSDIFQSVRDNPNNIFNTSIDTNAGEAKTGECIQGGGNKVRKNMWYDSDFNDLGYKEYNGSIHSDVLIGGPGDAMFSNRTREGAVYTSTISNNSSCRGHANPYVQWGFYGKDDTLQGYGCGNLRVGTACNIINNNSYKPNYRYNLMFIR